MGRNYKDLKLGKPFANTMGNICIPKLRRMVLLVCVAGAVVINVSLIGQLRYTLCSYLTKKTYSSGLAYS